MTDPETARVFRLERWPGPAGSVLLRLELALDREPDAQSFASLARHERDRAARFVRREDRVRFVAARAALREHLATALGVNAADVPVELDERSKPFVTGLKGSFSIAHSGAITLLAFRDDGPVGVDVEWMNRRSKLSDIEPSVFHLEELQRLAGLAENDRAELFFDLWVRKEAALKALGTGFLLDPKTVCVGPTGHVSLGEAQWNSPVGVRQKPPHAHGPTILTAALDIAPGYAAALAWSA